MFHTKHAQHNQWHMWNCMHKLSSSRLIRWPKTTLSCRQCWDIPTKQGIGRTCEQKDGGALQGIVPELGHRAQAARGAPNKHAEDE